MFPFVNLNSLISSYKFRRKVEMDDGNTKKISVPVFADKNYSISAVVHKQEHQFTNYMYC